MILKKYAPIFFTLFFSSVFGQNIAWNFGSAAPSTNTTSNLTVGNVTQGNVNGAVTMLSNTSVSSGYAGASGGNNAGIAVQNGALNTATSSYFEFVLTPAAGFTVSLNSISFGMRSTGTGPVNFVVRSSSDSYASNLASGTDSANSAWTLKSPTTTTVTSGNGTAITFRIYGFGGTGAVANTAQWRIDDLQLTVTVNQVFALNGNIDEAVWGTALATSAGGPTPSFGASHAINAVYSYGDATYLYFAIAGNVQSGNRILLFIDSATGGFNNGSFNRTNAPSGVNNWNSGTTFDSGFNADYCAVIGTNGSGTYFLDLFTLTSGTGSNTFIGSAGSEFGINVDNTSLTRGFEFRIPKTALNYTANQELQLFAAYTSDGGFLSNQFLTRANSGDGSYGSGAVTFGSAAPNPITVPYVSRQTGNWADAATWRLGTGNPTNVGISILNGHNVTVAAAAGNINALNVNTGGTLTIGGTNTLSFNNTQTFTNAGTTTFSGSGFITMGTNSTLANSGTLTMGSGALTFGNAGILNQTGTFTAGTSTVTFNGQGTISGTVVANNITANGQLTLSNAVTVNGTLRLNLNSFVDGANSPTYGSASTLLYNHGGAFSINRGNEWTSATSGAGFPNNVTLSNNTTFNMNLGTSASMGGILTVDSGSIFNSLAGTLNIAGSVLNNGTLNTGAGGIVSTGTVTNNGSLVLNGDFTTSANWIQGASATQTNNSRAVFFTGTGTSLITKTGGGTITFDYLVVNKTAGSVQQNSSPATNVVVGGTTGDVLQLINASTYDINGNSLTINGTGTAIGISTNATGRTITSTAANGQLLISNSNKAVTGTGTLILGANVTTVLATGFDFGASKTTINGNLQLNPGGFVNNTNAPIYTNTSTLIYNNNYNVFDEWRATGTSAGLGVPQNVVINSGFTVNMPNADRGLAGNLTATAANAVLSMNATSGNLFVGGNLNFNSGNSFVGNGRSVIFQGSANQNINVAAAPVLTIPSFTIQNAIAVTSNASLNVSAPTAGAAITITNAGGTFTWGANTLTIGTSGVASTLAGAGSLVGNAAATLILQGSGSIGTLRFTGTTQLGTLTINRTAGAVAAVLGSALTVNTAMNLTAGILDLNTSTLTLGTAVTAVAGASSSNFIIADVSVGGALRKNFTNGTAVSRSFTYPIGTTTTQYTPATFSCTTGDFATANLILSVDNVIDPNNESDSYITRYWQTSATGITNATFDFSGTYLAGDVVGTHTNMYSGRYIGSTGNWIIGNLVCNPTCTNTVSFTGLTTAAGALSGTTNTYTAGDIFRRAEINVLNPSNTSIATGATFAFGSQSAGNAVDQTFTIQNLGLQTLNLSAATVTGAGFSLFLNYSSTVTGGSSTTFTIRLLGDTVGTVSGSISIPNNDITGSENPFVINFSGTITCYRATSESSAKGSYAADEVSIDGRSWFLSEALIGDQTNDYKIGSRSIRFRADVNSVAEMLEDQLLGINAVSFNYRRFGTDAITATFVVEYSKDSGNSWIQLGAAITPTGTVQTFNQSLQQSGPVRLRIKYNSGTTNANHRFNIDDLEICPFNAPAEIEVFGNQASIQDGSTTTSLQNNTKFSNSYFTSDGVITKTFTITNTGTGTLSLSQPTLTGASEFSISAALPITSLSAGQSTSFSIEFSSTTAGPKIATVSIVNNDSNENPFNFDISADANNYKRCALTAVTTIAQQTFETSPASPVVNYTGSGGTFAATGGTAYGDNRTTTTNKFIGAQSYQVTGATAAATNVLSFDNVVTTNYKNISLTFNLGFYGTNSTQGLETSDEVRVAISTDGGTTYVDQILIRGNNNALLDINTSTVVTGTKNYTLTGTLTTFGARSNSVNGLPRTYSIINIDAPTNQVRVRFTIKTNTNSGNEVIAIDNVVIEGQQESTKTWVAGAWDTSAPSDTDKIIIDDDFNTGASGSLQGCECQINSGRTLTIASNTYAEIQSNIVNNGNPIVIEDSGSLIQYNDNAVNVGDIEMTRITSPYEEYDYVYWSSPVTATTFQIPFDGWRPDYTFAFNTAAYEDLDGDSYDDDGNAWVNIPFATQMIPGVGYAVMAPTDLGTYPTTATVLFAGSPNNGQITYTLQESNNVGDLTDDYNLVGNPYPSAISADSFINENLANFEGTIYLWTHVGDIQPNTTNPGPGGYNFSSDDYAMYNLTGGIGVGTGSVSGSTTPNGFIAAGQAFFIEGSNAGSIVFRNSMRGLGYNNQQFFRPAALPPMPLGDSDQGKIWLKLHNSDGMSSQQLIAFLSGATDNFDKGYDGKFNPAGAALNFYSRINTEFYRIQALGNFSGDHVVPLGFTSGVSGQTYISIDQFEGVFVDVSVPILLYDALLDIHHDLRLAPYGFMAEIGAQNNRFYLKFNQAPLSISTPEPYQAQVDVVATNNQIIIKSELDAIKSVQLFDLNGRLLCDIYDVASAETQIETAKFQTKILLVKIELESGIVSTRKVIKQ